MWGSPTVRFKVSHPQNQDPSLWASKVPSPLAESSSIWSGPHCTGSGTSHTSNFTIVIINLNKPEDIRDSKRAERDAIEQVLTSRRRNKARPRRARRRRGATSSTWWWTSCCCDHWGPTQAREEDKAQNQSEETEGGKKKVTSERTY